MVLKIASWNCCLGLKTKIDVVTTILKDYSLDVLYIQEAEIEEDDDLKQCHIQGFNLETSPTYKSIKSRSCCYVRTRLKYSRLSQYEKPTIELIVLKINETIVCGFYRPFKTPYHNSAILYVEDTVEAMMNLPNENLVVLGDFNIDLKKIHQSNYQSKKLYEKFETFFLDRTLVQMVKSTTWQRCNKNELKESTLDHIYMSDVTKSLEIINEKQVTSDHNLIGIAL